MFLWTPTSSAAIRAVEPAINSPYVNILHTDFSYIATIIISLDNIQDGRLDFIEQNSFGQPVFTIINKDEVIPANIINRLTGVIDLNKKNTDRIQSAVFLQKTANCRDSR